MNQIIKELDISDHKQALRIESISNQYPWSDYSLANALIMQKTLGLFVDGILVCFVIYNQILQDSDIIHVVCHKEFQNQGYTSKLLTSFIRNSKLENISQIFLEVRKSNSVAIALYNKLGFLHIGIRKNYYSLNSSINHKQDSLHKHAREDALSMKLIID